MSEFDIEVGKLLLAAGLLLVNVAVSRGFGLGLDGRIAVAGLRMTVQLVAVGLILEALLSSQSAPLAAATFAVMMLFAAREVRARQTRPLKGLLGWLVCGAGLWLAACLLTLFALTVVIGAEPWWDLRFAVPLFGVVLGNAMTGVSLVLEAVTKGAARQAVAIEGDLALGATIVEALSPLAREALATGMTPILNNMAATGLVLLPGLMVGQILAGVPPMVAVRYQLMLMFLLASGTAIATILSVLAACAALTDSRHRLRFDRLAAAR